MKIQLKILNKEFYGHKQLLPTYATAGSAAIDLVCTEDLTVYPGETKQIRTGLAIWIGTEQTSYGMSKYSHECHVIGNREFLQVAGLIVPRSGLGSKGLVLANTIGIIDEDYQGELLVNVWNRLESNVTEDYSNSFADEFGIYGIEETEKNIIKLKAGDRFAQLMFVPVIKAEWDIVEKFSNETDRNNGGFGSTGK